MYTIYFYYIYKYELPESIQKFCFLCIPSTLCFANNMCSINMYSINENYPDSLPNNLFPAPIVVCSYFCCEKS